MNPISIGLLAFVGLTVLGYLIREFAVGRLSAEQLGRLAMQMRPYRIRFGAMAATQFV